MQLIRKIGIAFLAITIIATSNLILKDNADYRKASATSGVEEVVASLIGQSVPIDSRYTYYVRATNFWSNPSERFVGFDDTRKMVWEYNGSYAQVPNNLGIVNLMIASHGGGGITVITRRIKDTSDLSYNPTSIFEFVDFTTHTGLNFSKYSYHIQNFNPESSVGFIGYDSYDKWVWISEDTKYNLQVPENLNINSIRAGSYDGGSQFSIFRKLKNTSPSFNILTANNHVLSDVQGHNILNIEGFVQDPDNDTLTVTATVDGKSKSVNVSNTNVSKLFNLKFDVIADKLSKGTHTVTITASDGKGGTVTKYLTISIITFVEDNKYVLIDELLFYLTKYKDEENDPMLKDEFMYDHDAFFFENSIGTLPDSGLWRDLSYESLSMPGHYKIYYKAMDNPNSNPNFTEFQKWSPPTPALNLFVHRKPVPEFSFTMNKTTRAYTVTNEAFDLDKYSMNIGKGPGIQTQKFEWRQKGQTIWNAGLPPSPLSLVVYEVKNTVVDFQNREEFLIKEMNATGLNVPPIPSFQIDSRIPIDKTVQPKDFSWDPNGDAIVGYQWQMKKKGEPDSAFKDIPNSSNIKEPNITFTALGNYVIRLKVKDAPGAWSAPPPIGTKEWDTKEVEVYLGNNAPLAGFDVEPTHYIGQKIKIISKAADPDGDHLTYEYSIKPPNSPILILKTGEPYIDRKGNNISIDANGDFEIQTYNEIDLGTWTFGQKVTDSLGVSDTSETKHTIVLDLTVTGQVLHTQAWQQIHENEGNEPGEFYSGEKFILTAEVSPLPIKKVNASVSGRLENNTNFLENIEGFTLDEINSIRYNSEYFDEQFAQVGTQIRNGSNVEFIFTAVYENGTPEGYSVSHTVKVKIIGSGLGLLYFHQSF